MINFDTIWKPTLLLDTDKTVANIQRMCRKTESQHLRFRPHFKTHQSALIGEWFRREGVSSITVSSVDMALYFSQYGWADITIAFPVNWRQIGDIRDLARHIRLGLLVESAETVQFLGQNLADRVDIWIKIDVGMHRTGLTWDNPEAIRTLAEAVREAPVLRLGGLLTHEGQTYGSFSLAEVCERYQCSVERMNRLRDSISDPASPLLEVSVGDTPGCTLCTDLGRVDEIRPGNFVFYDATQLHLGVCRAEDIAVSLAVPVVALHPERQEVVVYGGAIHLSKDYFEQDGHKVYGYVAFPGEAGWGSPVPGAWVASLSQEHGIIRFGGEGFDQVRVGDLLCILPAHSCLTVSSMRQYLTLSGETIPTM